jgi:hypothetical protein
MRTKALGYTGDMTLGESIGSIFWGVGELAFKWVPGVTVSLFTSQGATADATPQVPAIGSAVTTGDIVDFLKVNADPVLYQKVFDAWRVFVGISMFLSLLFGAFLLYSFIRIVQHRRHHFRHIEHVQHSLAHGEVHKTVLRWDRIKEQANSDNEQSWRLAILEADIMLSELLDTLGYRGETMADKMRQVDRADFRTIDLAWEAHNVRNRIAHEGSAHSLSAREARRVIDLYDAIFKEHGYTG